MLVGGKVLRQTVGNTRRVVIGDRKCLLLHCYQSAGVGGAEQSN